MIADIAHQVSDYITRDHQALAVPVPRLKVHGTLVSLSFLFLLTALGNFSIKATAAKGEMPTILLVMIILLCAVFVANVVLTLLVNKISRQINQILFWLVNTGVSVLVFFGLLYFILFIDQFENWLLAGSVSLTISTVVPTATITILMLYYSSFLYRPVMFKNALWKLWADTQGASSVYFFIIPPALFVLIRSIASWSLLRTIPLLCDEANTFWLFGKSLLLALTCYDKPNNHILNSVMVFASTQLFGVSEEAIRLPAFAAGVLSILAGYILAKKMYNWLTAMIYLALATTSAWMLLFSFEARGYIFTILLSPLVIYGLYLTFAADKRKIGWTIFVTSFCFSFAFIPTALYYWISVLGFGLLVFAIERKRSASIDFQWLKQFVLYMGIILAFAGASYLNPVFYLFRNGLLSEGFFSFPTIQPTSEGDLIVRFLYNTMFNGTEMITSKPMVLSVPGVVMVFGAAAAIITFFKNKQWVQAALYGCLFLIPIVIVGFQQSIPFPRNFSYLAPMVYLLSAYGLVSFGKGIWGEINQRWMIRIDDPKLRIAVVAVTFVIAGLLLLDSFTGLSLSLAPYHANKLQMADISPFLKNHEYISMLAAVCW